MGRAERDGTVGAEGVRFFGSIAAGLSHELSNVLNIINEIAGLQHDIAVAAAEGGDARVARVADLAGRIRSQVGRGEEINRRLHGFAHSIDDAATTFDLGRLLALLAFLEERTARLAGVQLTVQPPERDLELTGDPFALLLALHGGVSAAIAAAAAEARIEVAARPVAAGVAVTIRCCEPRHAETAAAAPALLAGAAAWGAAIACEDASIVIAVPNRPADPPHIEGGAPPGRNS